MSKICDYVYCDGHDVICSITNTILGDIMGYDGKNATREVYIPKNTIICQFRIIEHQPPVDIV